MKHKVGIITRHKPNQELIEFFQIHGFEPEWLGDVDAFEGEIPRKDDFEVFCVVHPTLLAKLIGGSHYDKNNRPKKVIIIQNGNRAAEGERPSFYPEALWMHEIDGVDDGVTATTIKKLEPMPTPA